MFRTKYLNTIYEIQNCQLNLLLENGKCLLCRNNLKGLLDISVKHEIHNFLKSC